MSSKWVNWFSEEDTSSAADELATSLQSAHECLQAAEMPWFKRYMEHLDFESSRPGKIGDHVDMIASVARANTIKDMRSFLLNEIAKARSFIASTRES